MPGAKARCSVASGSSPASSRTAPSETTRSWTVQPVVSVSKTTTGPAAQGWATQGAAGSRGFARPLMRSGTARC
ncbi:hypothetical protein ACFQY5_14865 [Paeniroseomonas aquatica]|uniref:hypothetical protein n=1 Tax=Paeniroseomonas aquatica TaxID=373043 RepID=UPI003615B09B